MTLTKKEKSELGKKSRQSGGVFERRVRADSEEQGYIITKWQNQVDFKKDKVIPAPHRFNPYTKSITPGQGFPDFLVISREPNGTVILGLEAKSAKYLDANEKKMCDWYLEHKIFDQILVAYKNDKGHISYYEYKIREEINK